MSAEMCAVLGSLDELKGNPIVDTLLRRHRRHCLVFQLFCLALHGPNSNLTEVSLVCFADGAPHGSDPWTMPGSTQSSSYPGSSNMIGSAPHYSQAPYPPSGRDMVRTHSSRGTSYARTHSVTLHMDCLKSRVSVG